MKSGDQDFQQIERYLKGEMPSEEMADFQDAIASDSQLNLQVKIHQIADDAVIANRLQNVKSLLKEEFDADKNPGKGNLLLGSLALLTVAGGLLYSNLNEPISEKLSNEKVVQEHSVVAKVEQPVRASEPSPAISDRKPQGERKTPMAAAEPVIKKTDSVSSELPEVVVEEKKDVETTHPVVLKEEINLTATTTADPCINTRLQADISATAACPGESNGEIIISGIKGGKAPYSFKVLDQNKKEREVSGLEAGSYIAVIKDINGCTKEIDKIKLTEKACIKDYHFNPFYGETWEIPSHEYSGEFTVYDNGGNVYFSKRVDSYSKDSWDGSSNTGGLVPGFYLFEIKYSDGTQKQGTITLSK